MKCKTNKRARFNQWTGKPRRWIWHASRYHDELIELLEVLHDARYNPSIKATDSRVLDWFAGKRVPNIFDPIPKQLLVEMERRFLGLADSVREAIARKSEPSELSESELRYCEAEGIVPEDFAMRKDGISP